MTTLCTNCGFNNPPGMRFCGNCGTRLAGDLMPATPQAALDFSPEQIGVMMGADLMERMHRAGLEAAGQRRNVTVLFTDLTGYTAMSENVDSEDLYDLVEQYIHLLVNDVYKYEGIVDKLTGDGLMALFGAPISHENNAERAVRAALDMQNDVAQLSREIKDRLGYEIRMRVGLHSGTVVVGSVGSNYLMNYTAIGDTVNLARRIEEAAPPGAILVSESVYRQIRPIFDCQQVSTFKPKGIARPVTAFCVMGLKLKPGTVRGIEGLRAPMIGRDQELALLKRAVTNLLSRKEGQFIMITGEAGLGKSRLTAEFKASLDPHTLRVLEGQTLAYRRSVSYGTFLELLYSYLGVSPSTPQLQVRERLVQQTYRAMGRQAADVVPYLEHLLSLPYSDTAAGERLRFLDAGQLRQQIFLAVRDLFLAETFRRPILLILEDLHWADQASLELLHFLLDSIRQAPLFFLGISRQILEGSMSQITEWSQQHLGERFNIIELQSLSIDQAERLLSQLLTIPDLPVQLREQILQRAAGIPFYLEEILRMLIDNGLIQRENSHWQLVPGVDATSLGVPETLQELILARFDRLNPVQRYVLQIASVIGKNFNVPVLNSVLQPQDQQALYSTLASLVDREFIQPQSGEFDSDYTFRHILMSDAIYGTMLRKERNRLHGLVGEAIETLYADRLDEQVELLARHYSWSPNLDRALYYLILAGQKAARRYVNTQAQQHFEQALGLLPEVPHSPEQDLLVHAGLGDLLVLTGEYANAREQYQAALQPMISEAGCRIPEECSGLQRKIGTTYERQGEYDQALVWFAQAQKTLEPFGDSFPVEKARILSEVGWISLRRGSMDEAERYLVQALSLAEGNPQYDVTASIYNRLGGVYYQKDQLDKASNFVQKSLALREEIGDIVAVARSYNNLGLLNWRRGKWESALESFMRSYDLHANLGDVEGMVDLHGNLGLLQLDRGDVEESRKHLEQSLAVAQQIGHTYITGMAYLYFCRLYVSLGDWRLALENGRKSLDILQRLGAQDDLISVYNYLGLAEFGPGNLEEAERWARQAVDLYSQIKGSLPSPQSEERGRSLRLLGDIARARGEFERAESLIKESSAIFMAEGNQLEHGRSSSSLALLAAARGDLVGARILLKEARLVFRQLGANLDLRKLEVISVDLNSR